MYYTDTKELKKMMIDAGINSVTDLSKKAGINRNELGYVLRGVKKPSSGMMERLVAYFKMTPEQAGNIFFAQDLRDA